jgi:hypothetical protein
VFQGEKGQKLLELSRRFKGDDRFKLDSRFIDDGEDERVGADGDKHGTRANDNECLVKGFWFQIRLAVSGNLFL